MENTDIFLEVTQRLHQKTPIDDEVFFSVIDTLSDRFEETEKITEEAHYCSAFDSLSEVWHYQLFEPLALSHAQSYLYGAIWGALKLVFSVKKKKETSRRFYALASRYEQDSTKYTFLNSVLNRPGIQNNDLAAICGVSAARISQISNEAQKDGLISTYMFGKGKNHYIQTSGENVLNIIQKRRKNPPDFLKVFDYNMIYFSNEQSDFLSKYQRLSSIMNDMDKKYNMAVAVAFASKQRELPPDNIYDLENEREDLLCIQETIRSTRSCMNFWNNQKEVNMISQP